MHTNSTIMHPTGVSKATQWRLQAWLGIDPGAKSQVYSRVFATTEINSLMYWLGIFFSAGIATFGLVESSPAVIIGAMLISPLMGPIMATGLALAVGNVYMGAKSVLNLVLSVAVSIAFSALLVWLLPFHSETAEILARTKPNLLDLGIALLSGLAGSVVVVRGSDDGITALPGVAIAVALMPPLCTMGFGLGSGGNLEIMGGAGLLFLTNLVAIVASAFVVFLLVGMGSPEARDAIFEDKENEPLSRILSHRIVARMVATGGQLRWRVLMLVVLLGSIAVPLRRALMQVAGETLTRTAVQEELKRMVPSDEVVSQSVTLGRSDILIHVISTRALPDAATAQIRQDLMRRTGRNVEVTVEAIASKSELAELMARFDRPAPAAPKAETAADLRLKLRDMVAPAIQEIWPNADAPLQDFDVVLSAKGVAVHVQYQAPKDLTDVPLTMVQDHLRAKLALPDLTLTADRLLPPGPVKRSPGAEPRTVRK